MSNDNDNTILALTIEQQLLALQAESESHNEAESRAIGTNEVVSHNAKVANEAFLIRKTIALREAELKNALKWLAKAMDEQNRLLLLPSNISTCDDLIAIQRVVESLKAKIESI